GSRRGASPPRQAGAPPPSCRGARAGGETESDSSAHILSPPRRRGPIPTASGIWVPSISAFTRVFDALCAGTTAGKREAEPIERTAHESSDRHRNAKARAQANL